MTTLKAIAILLAVTSLLSVSCKGVPPEAQPAAESWLALVDAGRYADSWTEAAAYFKGAIDSAAWVRSVGAVRTPIGNLKSRTRQSAQAVTKLPGAPDGEYVVFQFEASFDQKASAVETVTVTHEADGVWRVSGYYVK
jgi:hypothetical protein